MAPELVIFALAWWFGLYLLNRPKAALRYAGAGLAGYAVALGLGSLRQFTDSLVALRLGQAQSVLLLVPLVCWPGAVAALLDPERERSRVGRWSRSAVLGGFLVAFIGLVLDAVFGTTLLPVVIALALVPSAIGLASSLARLRADPNRPAYLVALIATVFFGLGLGALVAPILPIPRSMLVIGIGVDLALLGLALAIVDAHEEAELLRPDLIRSLSGAALATAVLTIPTLVTVSVVGFSLPLAALLLATAALAITLDAFRIPIERGLDAVVFARRPQLVAERAALASTSTEAPRRGETDVPINGEELVRLTRRALSDYGNLTRLAQSPLTRLPIVDSRLAARQAIESPLERAAELKLLLAERIAQLKPNGPAEFGRSDEWRLYNAVYFPYVVGLKPYRRRSTHDGLDGPSRQALQWFETEVPERTLHNWQLAAARLIADEF